MNNIKVPGIVVRGDGVVVGDGDAGGAGGVGTEIFIGGPVFVVGFVGKLSSGSLGVVVWTVVGAAVVGWVLAGGNADKNIGILIRFENK